MFEDIDLIQLSDAASRPLSEEVIPGLLDDGLVIVAAAERTGKTFMLISAAVHVASGRSWGFKAGKDEEGNYKVIEPGKPVKKGLVVYCIAEGKSFFTYRMTTACDEFGVLASKLPLFILDHSFNLMFGQDGKPTEAHLNFVEQVRMKQAQCGESCRMVVFDTLNRFMPGGDENKQADTSLLVRGAEWIRSELGCSVVLVHHVRKEGGVVRGSSVLTGAADQVLVCNRDKCVGDKMLWTTEDVGKRKDRDAVNQWTELHIRPMTDGEATPQNEQEAELLDWSDHIVWQEKYDDNGELVREVFEQTGVMKPCEPPTPGEELKSRAAKEILKALTGDVEYTTGELIRLTGQPGSSVYRAVKELKNAGMIEPVGKTRRYRLSVSSDNFGAEK